MRVSALLVVVAWVLSSALAAFAQDGEGAVRPDPTPLPATPLTLKSLDVTDLRNVTTNLLTLSGRQLTVMVFLYPECPLSRQAIPVLNQIAEELSKKGGVVLGLFRDAVTRSDIEGFASEFKTRFPLLRDPGGKLATVLHATTTPEAFVVDATGRIRYAGRVDDQYRVRGVRRPAPEREDLQEAVRDVLAGVDVRVPRTRPVGCPLNRKEDPADPEPASTEVTYHREVIRILNTHCLKCHSEGGAAPFTLTSYDDVTDWMKTALREIRARRMPPAQVESELPIVGNNHLTSAEVVTLRAWYKAGMPEGNPADSAGLQLNGPQKDWDPAIGRPPDIIIEQPSETHLGPKGKDVYWFINFELNRSEDIQLQAIQLVPRNPRIVHHALLASVPHSDLAPAVARYAKESPGVEPGDRIPGYSVRHGLGFVPSVSSGDAGTRYQTLPSFLPGTGAAVVPKGHSWKIPAGSDLLIQMHYNRSGKQELEKSRIGIWIERKPVPPDKKVFWVNWSSPFVVIPKGAKNVVLRGSFTLPADYQVAAVYPHCHQIATQVSIVAHPPDGPATVLVRVPQWDFNWQTGVFFADPIWLPKGTVVECTQIYDNTSDNPRNPHSPPVHVFLGENTDNEMMFPGIILLGKDKPDPSGALLIRFLAEAIRGKAFQNLVHHKPRYVAAPDGTVSSNPNAIED